MASPALDNSSSSDRPNPWEPFDFQSSPMYTPSYVGSFNATGTNWGDLDYDTQDYNPQDYDNQDYNPQDYDADQNAPFLLLEDQPDPPTINKAGNLVFSSDNRHSYLPAPSTTAGPDPEDGGDVPTKQTSDTEMLPSTDLDDFDGDDPSRKVAELFVRCQTLHHLAYPSSSVDFLKMDLTSRLKQARNVIGKGHYSDVYKGKVDGATLTCVKVLRLPAYHPTQEKLFESALLRFFRELNNWCGLDHVNIARLLGFIHKEGNVGLVSPWYPNGNVVQYLQKHPHANKQDLILDVAEGIRYLHTCSNPLIHSDLKAANVLVDERGVACIADFGISKQMNDLHRKTGFTTASGVAGTTPWMAPELLDDEHSVTFASDIYSYGGLILEIMCPGKFPYHYLSRGMGIIKAKLRGELPDRTHYPEMNQEDALWSHVINCMANDPQERPEITTVVPTLYRMFARTPRAMT